MSLINEALKRANEVKPAAVPDVSAAPLQAVVYQGQPSKWLWVWYAVAVMAAGLLAVWAILLGLSAKRQFQLNTEHSVLAREVQQARASVPASPAPLAATQGSASTPASVNIANSPAPATQAATETQPVAVLPAEPPLAPAPPPVPLLKLQGIFYRPTRPTAMINSKMLAAGDNILDAKVLAITQESVTVERDGKTSVLTLP